MTQPVVNPKIKRQALKAGILSIFDLSGRHTHARMSRLMKEATKSSPTTPSLPMPRRMLQPTK